MSEVVDEDEVVEACRGNRRFTGDANGREDIERLKELCLECRMFTVCRDVAPVIVGAARAGVSDGDWVVAGETYSWWRRRRGGASLRPRLPKVTVAGKRNAEMVSAQRATAALLAMRDAGHTRVSIAKACGISPNTVHRLEIPSPGGVAQKHVVDKITALYVAWKAGQE